MSEKVVFCDSSCNYYREVPGVDDGWVVVSCLASFDPSLLGYFREKNCHCRGLGEEKECLYPEVVSTIVFSNLED